jgi:hypothetical protein
LETLILEGIRLRKPFLKQHLENALKTNITLVNVVGSKIPPGSLDGELKTNKLIKNKVIPLFHPYPKIKRNAPFNFKLVDPHNTSFLDMSNMNSCFLMPAFKFMSFHDVRAIDFSGTRFKDYHMQLLSAYISTNPSLYSVKLDNN